MMRIIDQMQGEGLSEHLHGQVKPVLLANLATDEERYVLYVLYAMKEPRLSPLQDKLARLLSREVGAKQAALELGMALHTVKEQKRRIFDKLGIHSTNELILYFAAGRGGPHGPSTASPEPRKTLFEIRVRAEGLLARLLEDPTGTLGHRGTLARARSRLGNSGLGTMELADVLRDGWQYLLRFFLKPDWCHLTPREWEVVCLAACDLTNKEIAGALCISWHTVRAHLTPALNKLGAASRVDILMRLAARLGAPGPAKN